MPEVMTNAPDYADRPRISYSEITALQRCTQKHDYAYRQGLVPLETPGYFTKGRYLHALMASWLRGLETMPEITSAARTMMEEDRPDEEIDVPADVQAELHPLVQDFITRTDMDGVQVVAVEQEFYADLDLLNGTLLHGFIDAVLRTPEGVWLVEHKTAGRAWSQGQFIFDFQPKLYALAWEELTGEPPLGVIYNFFYPKRWEQKQMYLPAEEILGVLPDIEVAIEMREFRSIMRSPHWGCNDCSAFKTLCHAEMIGQDTEYLREQKYRVDDERVARYAEEA